jgi:hypothetical protein
MTKFYWLILGVLAVWRITHLLVAEEGPFRLFLRWRNTARISFGRFWGELFNCFYCLSLWVAAPLAWLLGGVWTERLILWPALSGAAILLERATAAPMPDYTEDPGQNPLEVDHELLWTTRKSAGHPE